MLTRDEVLERLNISPSTLGTLVRDRIILEVRANEEQFYPIEQFTGGGINARFASLLGVFRNIELSNEEVWEWINNPLPELEFSTPLEIAREEVEIEVMDQLRFIAAAQLSFKVMNDPNLERTDWLQGNATNVDPNGLGDYSPERRGGQYGV